MTDTTLDFDFGLPSPADLVAYIGTASHAAPAPSANPASGAGPVPDTAPGSSAGLRAAVARFESPSLRHGIFQIATSVGLFCLACVAMYWSFQVSYLLTLALALPASGLLVRVFIIQHDCGHGAFFKSRRANDLLGMLCSVLTFTPYWNWRRQHNVHHGNWNHLDRRAVDADMYSSCLTVEEYRLLSPGAQFRYRILRHPVVAQLILPPIIFLILNRIPYATPKAWSRERRSIYLTNLAILGLGAALALIVGVKQVLLVQVPIIALTSIIGVCLFALQHRFEDAAWARKGKWSVTSAALSGSSFLKLPRVLQWFTGNIGFHHIHHLSSRVPNYRLAACHAAIPAFRDISPLSLGAGLRDLDLMLWDEADQRLVRFRDIRKAVWPVSAGAVAVGYKAVEVRDANGSGAGIFKLAKCDPGIGALPLILCDHEHADQVEASACNYFGMRA